MVTCNKAASRPNEKRCPEKAGKRRETIASALQLQPSPFSDPEARALDPAKFKDPWITAKGEARARVALERLETLWFNTGTLCNLTCKTCYIESSPTNDALIYLALAEVEEYLDEAEQLGVREIGFTGGEPFMNRDIVAMVAASLKRGFEVLVLTNAMRPMWRFKAALQPLARERLTIRVSLDHHTSEIHEQERGLGSWTKAIEGLCWLSDNGFRVAVAARRLPGEDLAEAQAGYARLFTEIGAEVAGGLVLFPEMEETADVPEISEHCWDILGVSPSSPMCSSSRMVVKAKGADRPHVVACTLLPYDPQFALGSALAGATGPVPLNHPHCARFCVLGGASCSS